MSASANIAAANTSKSPSPPTPETPQVMDRRRSRPPTPPEKGEPEFPKLKPVLDPKHWSKRAKLSLRMEGPYGHPRESVVEVTYPMDVVDVRLHDNSSDPAITTNYYLRLDKLDNIKEDNQNIILLPKDTKMPETIVRERQVVAEEPDETGKFPINLEKYVTIGDLMRNLVAYWNQERRLAVAENRTVLRRQSAENHAAYPIIDPGCGDPGQIGLNKGCGVWTDILRPAYFHQIHKTEVKRIITELKMSDETGEGLKAEIQHMDQFWKQLYSCLPHCKQ